MPEPLQARIAAALRAVTNPRTGVDVMSSEMIRDVGVTVEGRVRFTILLAAEDPASQVRQPSAPAEAAPQGGRALPVMGQEPQSRRAAVPPAPTPVEYPNLGRVLAISSGKGGVGKTTVATNLAAALARRGARVGIMDADIYGPNIPRMMGVDEAPPVVNNRIKPLVAHGVKLMSLGFLVERDQPAIWRGPIVMKIVTQFLRDVDWGELDYF